MTALLPLIVVGLILIYRYISGRRNKRRAFSALEAFASRHAFNKELNVSNSLNTNQLVRLCVGRPLVAFKGNISGKNMSVSLLGSMGQSYRSLLFAELDLNSEILKDAWFSKGGTLITVARRDFYINDPEFDKQVIVKARNKDRTIAYLTSDKKSIIVDVINNSCQIKDGKIIWSTVKFSNIEQDLEKMYGLFSRAVQILAA